MAGRSNRVKPGTVEPTRWMLDDPQPGPAVWDGPTGVLEVDQADEPLDATDDLGPQFRAYDDHGNVRPADDRNLTELQSEVQDAYVEAVQPTPPALEVPAEDHDPSLDLDDPADETKA